MIVCKNCNAKIERGMWEAHATRCWPGDPALEGVMVRRGNSTRYVFAVYRDIPNGVRLNAPIEGLVSWNMDELERV